MIHFFVINLAGAFMAWKSGCMAGWSCYNKLDQFILLSMRLFSKDASVIEFGVLFLGTNV